MTETKFTDLPVATALAATDLVAVSQDIGGTPVSRGAPIALLMRRVPTTRSGAHTLEAADEARYQRFTNAGNQVLTLPAAAAGISSGVYALGAEYRCRKLGSGELSLSLGSGVTVNAPKGGVNVAEVGDAFALVVAEVGESTVVLDWIGGSEDA